MRKRFLLYALFLFTLTLYASAADVQTANWNYSDTEHVFSCDLNLSGADMDGQIFAALFAESGRMKSVTGYPAADIVHIAVPSTDTTDYLRVLWLDSHRKPVAKQTVLRMRDNGKTAYEQFENSLRNSKHENLTQSGDPTRLLVSSSEALPWAEYGVENVITGANGFYVLDFRNYTDAKACKEALEKLPCVRYAEYDAVIKVDVDKPGAALLDGEAKAPLSWGVAETGIGEYAANLKERGLDKEEVIVAVVDTGVDSGHEFLRGRVLAGYDFWDNDDAPNDEHEHGTHVAGTVVDCTPGMNVKILPVRVLNKWGESTPLTIRRGIEYAVARGADIINLSLGYRGDKPAIDEAIQAAIDKNITVVVAACNANADASEYCPAHIEECITVAATEKVTDKLSRWGRSNYGKVVDIAAPGGQVESSVPGGGYDIMSGTSQAAPHVSAAAALLMCEHGTGQTPYQIENTLKSAAAPLPEDDTDKQWEYYKRDNPGALWTDFLGAGFLNARPFIGFYALLYADGEFVFQKGNTPNPGKTLSATYPVAVAGGGTQYAPWYDNRAAIRVVTFADTLQPRSTATWFHSCENLTEIRGLERLDTSKVRDMSQMFARCTALTKLDLTALDTSGVTNTRQMFNNCTALETLDLTGWNTANVTNMADMFNGCTALKTVCASDSFKTDKVSNSTGMFGGCTALPNYDPAHTDKAYARIHGGTSAPGYFINKNKPTPKPEPAPTFASGFASGRPIFNPLDVSLEMRLKISQLPGTVYYALAPADDTISTRDLDGLTVNWYRKDEIPTSGSDVRLDSSGNEVRDEDGNPIPLAPFYVSTPSYLEIVNQKYYNPEIITGYVPITSGTVTVSVGGLLPETNYFAYFVIRGTDQMYSQYAQIFRFTTLPVQLPVLTLNFDKPIVNVSTDKYAIVDFIIVNYNSSALSSLFSRPFWNNNPSNNAEPPDNFPSYAGISTVLQALVTNLDSADNNGEGCVFDKYATQDFKNQVAEYIRSASSNASGTIIGVEHSIAINGGQQYVVDTSKYPILESAQYAFLAIGRSRSGFDTFRCIFMDSEAH